MEHNIHLKFPSPCVPLTPVAQPYTSTEEDDPHLCSLLLTGGYIYRQCIKYSDCEYNRLSQMFPSVASFTYRCCTTDLCNAAPLTAAGKPLLGLLASLAVFWWCVL